LVALASDKLVTFSFLRSYGLPVPEMVALYHPARRPAPNGVVKLGTGEALGHFLRSIDRPLFGKPLDSSHSLGCVSIARYDPQEEVVRLAFGQQVPIEMLRDYMVQWGRHGYLIQEHLRPHPDSAIRFGPTQSCIRMVVYLTPDGPELAHAACKIPRGGTSPTIPGAGTLSLASMSRPHIDPGRIRPRRRSGELCRSPDIGRRLLGTVLPNWRETVQLCLDASASLPGLRTQSWDVAITERGPVQVEVNAQGNFIGPQLASGKGILDERYNAHLQRCGYRKKPLSVRLAQSLARRAASRLKRLG
jgi:hypothetical protein